MASASDFSVYVHLTPTTHPDKICETLKISLSRSKIDPETADLGEESKIDTDQLGSSVDDLVSKVREFLTVNRNDGNKVYEVLAVSPQFMGVPLPLGLTASSIFADGSDVYATVRITVDSKRYVAPINTIPIVPKQTIAASALTNPSTNEKVLKFRTITKYSYFESGDKWIKVLLPDLAGLSSHPADKIKVEFPTNRSFSVEVVDFNGQNWQFAVPRTQCRILTKACTFQMKSSGLQVSLRKKNTSDNWWSLFKSKAIGEKDTDDED